ncbi:MAG: hypothetical protein Q7T54_03810 [Candidatus Levybacteria bacterium]|nr:hypothetical protein [Candidatus Levybacteria bacterium]
MNEKRFFRALFKTVLFYGFLHVILLSVLTIVTQKIEYLNVFFVVGINHYFPGIENGIISFVVSSGIVLVTYLLFYRNSKVKNT